MIINIISSNCNFNGDSEPIKIFDFKGRKVGNIINSNEETFFIDSYNDNKNCRILILAGNKGHIKSYDFKTKNIITKFHDSSSTISPHNYIIVNDNQLIESSYDGIIGIWNFYSGVLLKIINLFENYLKTICLLSKDYIIAGGGLDYSIRIIDLKNGLEIKRLIENNNFVINLRIINHQKYGKCLLSQGYLDDQIKM